MPHESQSGRETREAPLASTTRVWGVLGGIASGKSTVARLLAGRDGIVIDADRIVAEHSARPALRDQVARAFGPALLSPDGAIDRAALAARVFADPEARRLLESFLHPGVRAEIVARLEAARAAKAPRVVLDVPLLLENEAQHHLTERCDALIFVDAPLSLREERAMRSRPWTAGEVARRESQQMPLAQKRARATHTIENDGDAARLERQIQELLRRLEAVRAAPPPEST